MCTTQPVVHCNFLESGGFYASVPGEILICSLPEGSVPCKAFFWESWPLGPPVCKGPKCIHMLYPSHRFNIPLIVSSIGTSVTPVLWSLTSSALGVPVRTASYGKCGPGVLRIFTSKSVSGNCYSRRHADTTCSSPKVMLSVWTETILVAATPAAEALRVTQAPVVSSPEEEPAYFRLLRTISLCFDNF